jgi:PE-PPE domain/PE family
MAAAADEVSAAVATMANAFAGQFQAALQQAASFHDDFTAALSGAWSTYAQAEAANAHAAADVTLAIGGSGNPIPPQSYVEAVVSKYITTNYPTFTVSNALSLFTPESFYPLTGIKNLIPDVSVSEGVAILDAAIHQQLSATNNVAVVGFSQSSIIASLEMMKLDPSGTPSSLPVVFSLLGDPMNPNGGLLARFPGLVMPSLGFTFHGATPANSFTTNIYTIEYDGFADFPQYPINFVADLNAIAGIYYVHGTYADLTPAQINTAITLTNTVGPTTTTYHVIPNPHLPLAQGIRAIPVIGPPLGDLLEPDLRVLVNLGYGSPDQGWSTGPPNVPTPFGLFPPLNPTAVLGDLVTGTQQGIGAFVNDLSGAASGATVPSLLQALSMPPAPPIAVTPVSFANAVTSAVSTGYSVLLPTTDFVTAGVVSVPTYDAMLFATGIGQALGGDPVGLINAVGQPIAADVALFSIAGGFETIVLVQAASSIIGDFTSL